MLDWQGLFPPSIPILELFVRSTVTFLVLLVLQRILGQRESGGLGMTDLLVLVLLAQAVGPGLIGEGSSIADGIILVGTIMLWSLALDAVAYRWPRAALLIKGRPHLLIRDGRPNLRAMRREFLSMDELMTQLRLHGIEDVGDVRR